MVVFRVGAKDADFLAKEFVPRFEETDLVDLDQYNIYVKLMIDGITSEPFSALTLPPLSMPEGNAEKIIKGSRERYAEPRKLVEEKIARWSGIMKNGESLPDEKIVKYEAKCSGCGATIHVPFIPDGVRPVYCKTCLKKNRAQKEKNSK